MLELPGIIAHRGESASAPENTIAACELALNNGASWVEVDVNISRDGELFLHHDDGIERCTNGTGYLVQKSHDELRSLDAGSWFNKSFAGEKLGTLEELIELLAANNGGLNLEVKPTPGWEYPLVDAVCNRIRNNWPQNVPLLVSSFSPLALEKLRKQLPDVQLGLLVSAIPDDWQAWMQRFNCNTFHCAEEFVTKDFCNQANAAGIPVLCYTCNDATRGKELLSMGVSSIFSDQPSVLAPLLC